MFTGIIEETGEVVQLTKQHNLTLLTVHCNKALENTHIGDSIAVNGVCLTAIALTNSDFTVELQPETLRCTNLGDLQSGGAVNLERPMAPDGRFGGHMVQGHVDSTGIIREFRQDGPAIEVTIETEPELTRYIAPKGFIAVDGISLTVVQTMPQKHMFTLTIITHTQNMVTLTHKSHGDRVNIEVDIVAKYVESLLTNYPKNT